MTRKEQIIELLEDYEQHRILKKDDFANEIRALPLDVPDELRAEAREILKMKYITKINETPEFMKNQKRMLLFCKAMAEIITK